MKWTAWLIIVCYSAPLYAQNRLPDRILVGQETIPQHVAICGVDIVCAQDPIIQPTPPPIPDLSPLWKAIQDVAEKQAATAARVDNLQAQLTPLAANVSQVYIRLAPLETRITTLEAKPSSGPSALSVFFVETGKVLINPLVLAAISTLIGRYVIPAK